MSKAERIVTLRELVGLGERERERERENEKNGGGGGRGAGERPILQNRERGK